mgnify:CR=1 FL=1
MFKQLDEQKITNFKSGEISFKNEEYVVSLTIVKYFTPKIISVSAEINEIKKALLQRGEGG